MNLLYGLAQIFDVGTCTMGQRAGGVAVVVLLKCLGCHDNTTAGILC